MQIFPTITKNNESEILKFAYTFARYLEATDASSIEYTIDIKAKVFRIWLTDYIICRHDGIGLVLTEGATGGIWAWITGDLSMESVQKTCQGRNSDKCEVICGPTTELKKISRIIHKEINLTSYKFDPDYAIRNQIREAKYSKNSLKTLIDTKFLEYKNGVFSYKGKRLFMNESHILFSLEDGINKLPGGTDILFDCAFKEGKELAEIYGNNDWDKFIVDFFPALGFGDIAILDRQNPRIGLIYYPWTKIFKDSKYIVIRGLLSGVISHCKGKEIKLDLIDVKVKEYVNIILAINENKK